nr:hypothetical protein Saspl_047314 [Ipomoea batatas]
MEELGVMTTGVSVLPPPPTSAVVVTFTGLRSPSLAEENDGDEENPRPADASKSLDPCYDDDEAEKNPPWMKLGRRSRGSHRRGGHLGRKLEIGTKKNVDTLRAWAEKRRGDLKPIIKDYLPKKRAVIPGWHRSLSRGRRRCISGTGGIGQALRE